MTYPNQPLTIAQSRNTMTAAMSSTPRNTLPAVAPASLCVGFGSPHLGHARASVETGALHSRQAESGMGMTMSHNPAPR